MPQAGHYVAVRYIRDFVEKTGKIIAGRTRKRNDDERMDETGGRAFAASPRRRCGCSLLKVAVATGDPLSKEEMNMRTMTRGFYYDMAGEVARAADSIVAAALRHRDVAAVRWKIRATRAGVTAAMQGIPDVALADLWILCRMNEGFCQLRPTRCCSGRRATWHAMPPHGLTAGRHAWRGRCWRSTATA